MTKAVGDNWQNADPDSVSADDIMNSISNDDMELINRFIAWKQEVEELAKELMGNNVVLPWQS